MACLLYSCDQTENHLKGFQENDYQLNYKFLSGSGGENSPQAGDMVEYHAYFYVGDSLANSSREFSQAYMKNKIPADLEGDFNGNQLLQALSLMVPGDSLTFFKPADSLNLAVMPELFASGKPVFVNVALNAIITKAELAAEKANTLAGMDARDRGCYLEIVSDEEGPLPETGGGISYELRLLRFDQEIYSSYVTGATNSMEVPGDLKEARKKNPLLDGILELSEGDSAQIFIESDSIIEQLRPDWGFQPGDLTDFRIKMLEVLSPKQLEAERAKALAEEQKRNAEIEKSIEAAKANAAKIEEMINEKLLAYNNGRLKTISTASGLKYQIIQAGTGTKPQKSEIVSVHYSGHLLTGEKFDSSFDNGKPIEFPLGVGRVIKGWDEGISLLPVGTKAMFFIPSEIAYGQTGTGPIPPNAELCFYVELLGTVSK